MGVEAVYVKKTALMDQRRLGKYAEACRRLGFDRRRVRWVKPLEEMKTTFFNRPVQLTTSPTY